MRRTLALSAAAAALIFVTPSSAALRAPTLVSPGSAASVEAPPTFTWGAVRGTFAYEWQVSADRAFGSIVDGGAGRTANTAATLKTTLADGDYYWRVRALSKTLKAGRWSSVRSIKHDWATPPRLLEPTDDFGVSWPAFPLVLRWTPVPHATKYHVVIATDPSLAQPVLGTVKDPVATQGQALAVPGTLNGGVYYWAVTPLDADGHRGRRSSIGRFQWGWPSGLSIEVKDLNPAAEIFDPLLSWSHVPGASRYDVEVNTTPEFAPGSTFYSTTIAGTAVSPTVPVANNTYHWRVRAVDAQGRAGGYVSGTFRKEFDDANNFAPPQDTITGLTLRDGVTDGALGVGSTTSSPTLSWNPVPGAAEYEVQVALKDGPVCDWLSRYQDRTRNTSIDLHDRGGGPEPGAASWPVTTALGYPFSDGASYCVRVLARDGAGVRGGDNRNDSEWTYLGGTSSSNTTAFVFDEPTATPDGACSDLAQPQYLAPTVGQQVSASPRYRWNPVAGAKSYFIVVSRDEAFTEIVEVVLTDRTFYLPTVTDRVPGGSRDTYEDEQTSYYWAVWPSPKSDGSCFSQREPGEPAYPSFDKRSVPPTLQAPGSGAVQPEQPVFSWLSAQGAADYRIQVARDAEFRDVVDDVVTASTAYASTKTYPVDRELYWRVRARDANNIELNWSEVRSFRRTLPTPVPAADNPTGGETIPVLAWSPVNGAVSYDMHVDQADGTTRDFTVASPRFTPTLFYGTGIWRWKVRANFPAAGSSTVSGPYSSEVAYLRRIAPPTGLSAVRTKTRLIFRWNSDLAAKKYRLEVSATDSFARRIETVTTPNNSYAPSLQRGYADGGRIYWRVAVVDEGGNVGAFARGDLRLPSLLKGKLKGSLRRGARRRVVLTVADSRSTKIRGALVRVTGTGVRGRKRTNKRGQVVFKLRPRRRGTVTFKMSKSGYRTGEFTVRVL